MAVQEKWIAITFDDGPSPQTQKLLAVLQAQDAKATFFTTGNAVREHPEILIETIGEGHEIATHTLSHPHLSELTPAQIEAEITGGLAAVAAVSPVPVRYMRPPYGDYNEAVCTCCRQHGLVVMLWSISPADWRGDGTEIIARRILEEAQDGSIVVCHDWQPRTTEAMAIVLPALAQRGFRCVTLSDLLRRDAPDARPGEVLPR